MTMSPELSNAAVLVLFPISGFLLAREFVAKDKMAKAITSLEASVAALTLAVEGLKLWTTQGFLSRPEAKENLDRLKDDIEDTASGLEDHIKNCPARRASDHRV